MRRFIALNIWLVASCGGGKDLPVDKSPLDEVYSGCDPLDEALCALPFPSSYFQEEAQTASGVQNRFYEESLPLNRDGVRTRPELWNRLDGFSTLTPMLRGVEEFRKVALYRRQIHSRHWRKRDRAARCV